MEHVLRELAIEVPSDQSSLGISSEDKESLNIETTTHDVCLMLRDGVSWVVLAQNRFIVISLWIWPDM